MDALPPIPDGADLYLQPAGFCGPQHSEPDCAAQIAGLPVWASGVRVIARGYDGRAWDKFLSLAALRQAFDGPRGDELKELFENIIRPADAWTLSGTVLRFDQTRLMAVLNVTPDSFSDGGDHFDHEAAIEAGWSFVQAGADIIDIGGESTRPGATTVWEGDEIERALPVVGALAQSSAAISIDTRKAAVMVAALEAGAGIVNDVSALRFDAESLSTLAGEDCPIILMHAQGEPGTMQQAPKYDDVVLNVYDMLKERIDACEAAGIARTRLAVDPGIGFGKTVQHNLALINNVGIFHGLGCPIVLGVSRKRFIGALAGIDDPKDRLPGSIAAAIKAMAQGIHILRVHDVAQTRQALDIWRGLADEMQMPPAI